MLTREIYEDWMEETQREKIKKILEQIEIRQPVLDIGSGPGFLEDYIDALAVDPDPKNLEKIKGPKLLADGNDLPFPEKSFSTIFCIDTVHFIKEPEKILKLLKPDGRFVVTQFCNKYNYQEKLEELKEKFKNEKIEKEFLIKTDKEWDIVLILVP
jgi:SAM-dependent methyltransferase